MSEQNGHPAILSDGQLHFTVRTPGQPDRYLAVDGLLLTLTCDECVDFHHLAVESGRYKVTTAFLTDLAARLSAIGVTDCTPSLAFQLWRSGDAEVERVKKNTSETPPSDSGSDATLPE